MKNNMISLIALFVYLFSFILQQPILGQNLNEITINLYTAQTLNDTKENIPVVDLIVPNGFNASLKSEWNRLDGSYPGHEIISIENQDKSIGIYIHTNESYYMFKRTTIRGLEAIYPEGPNTEYMAVLMDYKEASVCLNNFLDNLGYMNRKLITKLTMNNKQNSFLKELEAELIEVGKAYEEESRKDEKKQVYIIASSSYENNQYLADNHYLEVSTCSGKVTTRVRWIGVSDVGRTTIIWTIPYYIIYKTPNKDLFDKYHSVYETVVANTRIRPEFYFINSQLKQLNANPIDEDGNVDWNLILDMNLNNIMSNFSKSDISESKSESVRISEKFESYIINANKYSTLDGNTLNFPDQNEVVAQKDNTFYIGNKSNIPSDFTILSKIK